MKSVRTNPIAIPRAWPTAGSLTAVVVALAEEFAPLVARTSVGRELRMGSIRVYCGRLGNAQVLLAHTGEGRKSAERGVKTLLENFPVGGLLVMGISGGLSPSLSPGTLVVARDVLDGQTPPKRGQEPFSPPDQAWFERALRCNGARSATVVSTDRLLCTPASKAEVWATLPNGGPAVVDLESAAYARTATRNRIPYLIVRAVCDPAEEKLPFDLNLCLDKDGRVSRSRVLRYALLHPAVIGPLWQLRHRVDRCSRRLASFVDELLNRRS